MEKWFLLHEWLRKEGRGRIAPRAWGEEKKVREEKEGGETFQKCIDAKERMCRLRGFGSATEGGGERRKALEGEVVF